MERSILNRYTDERNTQILIQVLKANGISQIIASPGTTNACFVSSLQNDNFFTIYSAPEERSAAYLACGMAAETGKPVVLSCTGATASRNYMPAFTEAFYRKLPVLAVTSSRRNAYIGHNCDQVTDRTALPNDVANLSVQMPVVLDEVSEWNCVVNANKAVLELSHKGGGPAHINLETTYSRGYVKDIPSVRIIRRVTAGDSLPEIKAGRVAIFVGSHQKMSVELQDAITGFCRANNGIVLCDHTSNYRGPYRAFCNIVAGQYYWKSTIKSVDLMIHIGDVSSSDYGIQAKEVWRVNPDGEIRDTFRRLTYVFEMTELRFFQAYGDKEDTEVCDEFIQAYREEEVGILNKIPELPFSNIWAASVTANRLPEGSVLHLGIRNSLRSWNFFETPETVSGYSNTGGFGIDGSLSSAIGAAIARPDRPCFVVLGDLSFFYDMNSLGNRHVPCNLRVLVVNNGLGFEMKFPSSWGCSIASSLEVPVDSYICASGHYSQPELIKWYARGLGFEYHRALSKDDYISLLDRFLSSEPLDKPMIVEMCVSSDAEDEALNAIGSIMTDSSNIPKALLKKAIGRDRINAIKSRLKG